jgi:hypothetical protein
MKLSAAILAIAAGSAAAARPQLSISVRDGNFDGLDGLDPTLKWENSGRAGDLDISYGVEAAARPTTDVASLPRGIWGKASTDVSGWGVSARADMDAQNLGGGAELEFDANNQDLDLSLKMTASAAGGFNVRNFEATKGLDIDGARLTVTPRLDLENDNRDVQINYSNDSTNVKLTASAENQEVELSRQMDNTNLKLTASAGAQSLTVSQQVDADNRIAPTINNNGDISVEWERRISDDSSLTANLKPNDSLDVEWRDNAWTANVNCALDGTSISGANVNIKRDVSF